ncbi:PDR/VanB family oxidoreductase [Duganella sp. PWIR1]
MMNVRVICRRLEAQDIAGFDLAPVDGGALPAFSAGAHIDVEIRPGLVRQYSLCNHPQERHRYQIAVLRDARSRGGSTAVHEDFVEGQIIRISEPRNHFPLQAAENYLLLAGGIGVTPIISMAEHLASNGAQFEMHYCSRSPDHAAFRERIRSSPYKERVHMHFDSERKFDLNAVLAAAPPGTHIYVCGPAGFIEFVMSRNWPPEALHREYFGNTQAGIGGDAAFEVRIASSGKTYAVATGESIVQALAGHGVVIPVSCEQGVCGTCITGVLDGIPDHRDVYFSDEEKARNDQLTPCCSRSLTRLLVLDL